MNDRTIDRDSRGRFSGRHLSDEEVGAIRRHAEGGESQGSLARRYGVDRSLVSRIVSGTRRRRRPPT